MQVYAHREEEEPEITAQGVDFSKPLDEQINHKKEDEKKDETVVEGAACYIDPETGIRSCE